MYTLREVSKCYSGVTALRPTTCTIPTKGLVVVMGPSGSGKSTLLRLLSFVELPDNGTVALDLDNASFASNDDRRPWPRVTCVFQKQFLWPHLTLRENISLPLRARGHVSHEAELERVIELFGMSEYIDRYPNEVSGGQAQRVALARALVLAPEVILIDEAHTGLDLEQQSILNKHLLTLRSNGVGLIVVSHSLEFASRFADNVIVIEDGAIVEVATREGIMNSASQYLKRAMELTKASQSTE